MQELDEVVGSPNETLEVRAQSPRGVDADDASRSRAPSTPAKRHRVHRVRLERRVRARGSATRALRREQTGARELVETRRRVALRRRATERFRQSRDGARHRSEGVRAAFARRIEARAKATLGMSREGDGGVEEVLIG